MNIVKFKSLHLENFKGFKMADVNFGDKTTTTRMIKVERKNNQMMISVEGDVARDKLIQLKKEYASYNEDDRIYAASGGSTEPDAGKIMQDNSDQNKNSPLSGRL